MSTKVRLWLDAIIQIILWLVSLMYLFATPANNFSSLFLTILALTGWQLLHTFYLVWRYQDWHRKLYLKYFKQLIAYCFFILIFGMLPALVSLGMLWPFGKFVWQIFQYMAIGGLFSLMVFNTWISLKDIRLYWLKPRSFWDL